MLWVFAALHTRGMGTYIMVLLYICKYVQYFHVCVYVYELFWGSWWEFTEYVYLYVYVYNMTLK